MALRVAVVGASGTVGRELLSVLDERGFPADEVIALGARTSIGSEVSFGDRELKMRDVEAFDWTQADLVFLASGSTSSRKWAPAIAAAGGVAIDASSAFRLDPDVPLIAPEANADAIEGWRARRLVSIPNSATAQLVAVLAPLHAEVGVRRAVVASYHSASGAGREGMDELWTQTKGVFVNQAPEPRVFPKQIAFNIIPQVDDLREDGSSEEEHRLQAETRKILGDIAISATSVRVPVFVGHCEAVHLELASPITAGSARKLLRESPGLMVVDRREEEAYVTPIDAVGEWVVFVSRIRSDPTVENGLALWIVADNLRKGAALNAVQVGEILLNRGALPAGRIAS